MVKRRSIPAVEDSGVRLGSIIPRLEAWILRASIGITLSLPAPPSLGPIKVTLPTLSILSIGLVSVGVADKVELTMKSVKTRLKGLDPKIFLTVGIDAEFDT